MSNELRSKRSALIEKQKSIVDAASKEVRALNPQEKETLTSLANEVKDISETIATAEGIENSFTADNAIRTRAIRTDTGEDEMSEKDLSKYSLLRAIRCFVQNKALDGVEREANDEIARRTKSNPKGFYVPTRILATRALDTTTGAGALKTAVSSDYIELLRAKTVMNKLGATFLSGLVGKFSIPRATAGANVYWIASEGTAPTAGSPAMDQVSFEPKQLAAFTDITRQFMVQSSVDAENFVRNDLILNMAVGVDRAAVSGLGNTGQPTGILTNATVAATADALSNGTYGGTPSFSNIVKMETIVASGNVDITTGAYLTTPAAYGMLKTTPKIGSTYPMFAIEDGEMNGYPVFKSNVVPSTLTKTGTGLSGYSGVSGVSGSNTETGLSAMIFGNWSDLVIGQWGALDLLVDPYSLSSSGGIRIVSIQDVDIELRHPESFAAMTDIMTL